jgi:hypothetical protein
VWERRPSSKRVNVLKKEVMTCRKIGEQETPSIKIAEKISKAFALSLFNPKKCYIATGMTNMNRTRLSHQTIVIQGYLGIISQGKNISSENIYNVLHQKLNGGRVISYPGTCALSHHFCKSFLAFL